MLAANPYWKTPRIKLVKSCRLLAGEMSYFILNPSVLVYKISSEFLFKG